MTVLKLNTCSQFVQKRVPNLVQNNFFVLSVFFVSSEEIETAIEDIELEISIKQWEMGYIDENGKPLIPMSLMTIDRPDAANNNAGEEE